MLNLYSEKKEIFSVQIASTHSEVQIRLIDMKKLQLLSNYIT